MQRIAYFAVAGTIVSATVIAILDVIAIGTHKRLARASKEGTVSCTAST
jgi:hypothetical protein